MRQREAIYECGDNHFFAQKTLGLKKVNDDFLQSEAMIMIDRNTSSRGIYYDPSPIKLKELQII